MGIRRGVDQLAAGVLDELVDFHVETSAAQHVERRQLLGRQRWLSFLLGADGSRRQALGIHAAPAVQSVQCVVHGATTFGIRASSRQQSTMQTFVQPGIIGGPVRSRRTVPHNAGQAAHLTQREAVGSAATR
jgi:hypothetical protein